VGGVLWEKMNAKQVLSCYKLMKTSVMLRRFLSVLVLLPVLAMAQPAAPSASSKADATALYDLVIENGILLRPKLQQAPANLTEVVKRLRELDPQANIVVAPDLGDLPVGDIKLHATELDQELDAIQVASGKTFIWNVSPSIHQNSQPLYRIEPSAPKTLPSAARVEVFNLTDYLARLGKAHPESAADSAASENFRMEQVKIVQSVVNQTLADLGQAYKPLNYEFHSGANLLIVMGNSDSLGIARTVLDGLIMPPPGQNQELDMLNGLMKTMQTRNREVPPDVDLRSRVTDLSGKLLELQAENDRLRALAKKLDQPPKPTP
jgi:hypothetical protein